MSHSTYGKSACKYSAYGKILLLHQKLRIRKFHSRKRGSEKEINYMKSFLAALFTITLVIGCASSKPQSSNSEASSKKHFATGLENTDNQAAYQKSESKAKATVLAKKNFFTETLTKEYSS